MNEPLELLSPLDLCTNLVNQKIGHYRAEVRLKGSRQVEYFDAIVAEAREHKPVWEDYVARMQLKNDPVLNEILNRVTKMLA